MFALPCIDIGNERWTTSGFLTRLSNGGPPQVPGTHAGTRGAGESDGIIAAVKEDEIYYHRDQCDMITMILRLAAEPPGDMNVGDKRRPRRIATGGLEVAEPESSIKPAPGRGCCIATSVLQGSSVILRKHTRARMVCPIIELLKKKKKKQGEGEGRGGQNSPS